MYILASCPDKISRLLRERYFSKNENTAPSHKRSLKGTSFSIIGIEPLAVSIETYSTYSNGVSLTIMWRLYIIKPILHVQFNYAIKLIM